jgi:protein TonB
MKALIVHKVPPKYPEDARNHRIQGTVLVDVIVGTNGKVTDTKLVFGHPALAKVTVDAIRKWKFKPYLLNGNPIEVETQVTMNFSLSGGVDQSSARVSINSSPE